MQIAVAIALFQGLDDYTPVVVQTTVNIAPTTFRLVKKPEIGPFGVDSLWVEVEVE